MALALTAPPVPDEETARWWREHVSVAGLAPDLDAVFGRAARQLPAVISRSGAIDASIWQYNREWVRDHSFMAHGLTSLGHHDHARAMLERLLREFITPDGAPMDSSERRAPEETELDYLSPSHTIPGSQYSAVPIGAPGGVGCGAGTTNLAGSAW